MTNEQVITQGQREIYERTEADEKLKNFPIFNMLKGVIASDVEISLGINNAKAGKRGACIVIEPPVGMPGSGDVVGAMIDIEFSLLVMENPVMNNIVVGGEVWDAMTIARRLVAVHQYFHPVGVVGTLSLKDPGIHPVRIEGAPVAFRLIFEAMEESAEAWTKVTRPTISPDGGVAPQTVTLACGTAGATMYYTTDGSYPRNGAAGTTAYTVPFAVATAKRVRAAAVKTGMIDSDVEASDFS